MNIGSQLDRKKENVPLCKDQQASPPQLHNQLHTQSAKYLLIVCYLNYWHSVDTQYRNEKQQQNPNQNIFFYLFEWTKGILLLFTLQDPPGEVQQSLTPWFQMKMSTKLPIKQQHCVMTHRIQSSLTMVKKKHLLSVVLSPSVTTETSRTVWSTHLKWEILPLCVCVWLTVSVSSLRLTY